MSYCAIFDCGRPTRLNSKLCEKHYQVAHAEPVVRPVIKHTAVEYDRGCRCADCISIGEYRLRRAEAATAAKRRSYVPRATS